jgi:hypothetical protein
MDRIHDGSVPNPAAAVVEAALQLKVRGWAVVESVITAHECERYIERFWDWLESLGTGGAVRLIIFLRLLCTARAKHWTGRSCLCIDVYPLTPSNRRVPCHGIGPHRHRSQFSHAGISRSDPATWSNDRWPPTFGDSSGIINCLEVCSRAYARCSRWQLPMLGPKDGDFSRTVVSRC